MTRGRVTSGYSLVEILVSLLIVSVTAVNISGLQNMIAGQNRDNFIHSHALKLATEKMEELLQFQLLSELEKLPSLSPIIVTEQRTNFILDWRVQKPDSLYGASENVRDVTLQISWQDSKDEKQIFACNEKINLAQLLNSNEEVASSEAAIVESFLNSNEIIYFEPKMSYAQGAFVIYNSELFQATSVHLAADSYPINNEDFSEPTNGWESYGLIDNPDIVSNELYPDLVTLFTH